MVKTDKGFAIPPVTPKKIIEGIFHTKEKDKHTKQAVGYNKSIE